MKVLDMNSHPVVTFGQTRGHPALIRGLNSLNALNLVRGEGAVTAARVAQAIGVSRTAIESILGDLMEADWLVRGSPDEVAGLGRPAARYDLSPAAGYVGAIEFDSERVGVAVADLKGDILATLTRPVGEGMDGDERAELGVSLFQDIVRQKHIGSTSVRCVSAASPGVINRGKVTHFGGHGMPGWIGRNLGVELQQKLGLSVIVGGDSALGALAEKRMGRGKDCDDFVYIYSGRRTGAAVISNGRIVRGFHGGVGLIGELPELRWRELESIAFGHDSAADIAGILGLGISAMVLAVDPELVLIGGPSRDRIAPILSLIGSEVSHRCPISPEMDMGFFGDDAVMRGAVCLAVDHINEALSQRIAAGEGLPSPDSLNRLLLSGNETVV